MLLAVCSNLDLERIGLSEASIGCDEVAADLPPAQRREHERIVAAYGGIYHSPALEALVASSVERLVAASERPELKYRATILNSPAINVCSLG